MKKAYLILAALGAVALPISLVRAVNEPTPGHVREFLGLVCITLAGVVSWRRLSMAPAQLMGDIRRRGSVDVVTSYSVFALSLLGAVLLFFS